VTDVPEAATSVPARMGARFRLDGDVLGGELIHVPAMAENGSMPIAALVFLVDAVAGVSIDTDPDAWAFTADLSVRLVAPMPSSTIDATTTILRNGARSAIARVDLAADGAPIGTSISTFSRVARRPTDPPKPPFDVASTISRLRVDPLDTTLRAACGFVEGAAPGVVIGMLRPDLLNPAGAMQGAIVAALAECAATDLADAHRAMDVDHHAVVDIDVRYLAQNRADPIVATASFVGPSSGGMIAVDLVDDGGRGRRTTTVIARMAPAS